VCVYIYITTHFISLNDFNFLRSGMAHSCALFTNEKMRCWGYGASGVLGNSDSVSISNVIGLGFISFSDTAGIVRLSQGGIAGHVLDFLR
jgi:hypothetical protein